MKMILGAGLFALLAAGPANAAVTYNVDGTFDNGSKLTGSFVYDDTAADLFQRYREFNLTAGGFTTFKKASVITFPPDSYRYFFFESNDLDLAFSVPKTGAPTSLDSGTYVYSNVDLTILARITSGTLKVAAVPESATWAMFIGGFGMMGGALRRRQRVAVRFA